MSSSKNYYELDPTFEYMMMEKVTLAEDLTFTEVKDIVGKFHFKIMTPTEDTSEAKDETNAKYKKSNYIEIVIPAYMLFEFMSPSIEPIHSYTSTDGWFGSSGANTGNAYFMTFPTNSFTIPKGTVFLAELLDGTLDLDNIQIIGIYKQEYDL